jgi:hypothetical protein
MKSFIQKAVLSLLTVTTLSLNVNAQAKAFTVQAQNLEHPTNQTIYRPQVELEPIQAQVLKEELIAQSVYCETRFVNGRYVSCCADSYGNWACAW